MLREAAAASAPGSVLITNLLTEGALASLRARRAARLEATGGGGRGSSAAAAAGGGGGGGAAEVDDFADDAGADGAAPADADAAPAARAAGPKLPPRGKGRPGAAASAAAAAPPAAATAAAPAGDGREDAAAAAARAKRLQQTGSSLTEHFQWGCPENVSKPGRGIHGRSRGPALAAATPWSRLRGLAAPQSLTSPPPRPRPGQKQVERFLAEAGWTVVQRHSWSTAARAYGWAPEPSRWAEEAAALGLTGPAAAPVTPEQEVQFVVAVRSF
jgi:hypothetical protein